MNTYLARPHPQRIQSDIANDLVVSNGQVRCPVCEKDIKVGMGGLPNFWKQHNPGNSKACQLNLKKKNRLEATHRSQPSLQSYFTEHSKAFVLPTVPIPHRVMANVIDPTSSVTNVVAPSSKSNTLTDTLLANLEKAISDLPSAHPDTINTEESTIFPLPGFPTDMDCDDAWECILDPYLNRFLGFGLSVKSISASLKGQKKELVSLAKFLRCFTGKFRIDGALLEGKVQRLIAAIHMLCVVISMHHDTVLTVVKYCRQGQSSASQPSDVVVISDLDDEAIQSMLHAKGFCKTKHQSEDMHVEACPGYLLTFPQGQWADTSYPFALHTLLSLPWRF